MNHSIYYYALGNLFVYLEGQNLHLTDYFSNKFHII